MTDSNNRASSAYPVLALCGVTGVFFAFIATQFWDKIQYIENPLPFPTTRFVFFICCITAYLAQGVAFVLIENNQNTKAAKQYFWGQFVLLALWLQLFFGLELFIGALFELLLTFFIYMLTFAAFRKIDLIAGALMIPVGIVIGFIGFVNCWFVVV